jgi:hypothetical protein
MAKPNQQLKKELKAKAKILKESGCPGYIHLGCASVEELQNYLEKYKDWNPEPETIPSPETEPATIEPDLEKVSNAKTLSQLGEAIACLEGKGDWKDWGMSLWTKNGECRVYMTDVSYRNPKKRGFYLIKEDGSAEELSIPNCRFPNLPPLPVVENDLVATPKLSPEGRAIRSLDAQFGKDGWNQFDYEDELEREEYQ